MVGALAGRNEKIRTNHQGLDRIQSPGAGDSVTVREPSRFQKRIFGSEKTAFRRSKNGAFSGFDQVALGGPWIMECFFVVLRPIMRWIPDSFQDTVEDMLPKTIESSGRVAVGRQLLAA